MASTVVDICNLALSRCRANNIGNFTENSEQAKQCRIFYPEARKLVLSDVEWPFNEKTVTLALKPFEPAEWTYAYALPTDCLFVRRILPAKSLINKNYQVAGDSSFQDWDQVSIDYSLGLDDLNKQVIFTNQPEARIVYGADVEDVRLYGQMASELIAWKMAQDLSIKFGGDNGARYRNVAISEFDKLLAMASSKYLNQSKPRLRQSTPKSVRARRQSSSTQPMTRG